MKKRKKNKVTGLAPPSGTVTADMIQIKHVWVVVQLRKIINKLIHYRNFGKGLKCATLAQLEANVLTTSSSRLTLTILKREQHTVLYAALH